LTRSSPSESLLPEAVSEALGISLSEVLNLYFGELDNDTRDHMVWGAINRCRGKEESERVRQIKEALERRRTFEEGEEWLAQESLKTDVLLERIHRGQDDDSF
jgi:hypothetical protein